MLTLTQVYRSRWFGPLVVVLVLATATALGFLSVRSPYYVVALAGVPLALVGLDFLLRRLHWIPMLILFVATLTSWNISKGVTVALIATVSFTVLWLLRQLLVTRQIEFIQSPVILPALAFVLMAVLSYVWAQIASDPFLIYWDSFTFTQLGQLIVFVFSPFALILTASLITHARHIKYLVYTFLIVALVGGVAELFQLPIQLNMGGLTYTWVVCLAFGQLLFNRTLLPWQRILFIGLLIIWIYVYFIRAITWISGWLPGMLTIAILTFFKSKRLFLALLILILVLVVASSVFVEDQFNREYNESGSTRLDRWQTLFEQPFVWNHWVLGMGPAGYARYFMTYIPDNAMSTHSNYVDIFLQLGVLGIVTLFWLMGMLTWEGLKLQGIPIRDPFLFAFGRSMLATPIVVLFAMSLGDWFTPFVYNQGLQGFSWTISSWIFLGAMTAIPNILKKELGERMERENSLRGT